MMVDHPAKGSIKLTPDVVTPGEVQILVSMSQLTLQDLESALRVAFTTQSNRLPMTLRYRQLAGQLRKAYEDSLGLSFDSLFTFGVE